MIRPARARNGPANLKWVQYRYPAYTGNEPCAGYEDLYLSEDELTPEQTRELRDRCSGCPLLEPCATWAIAHEGFGFWGGLTVEERWHIRRRKGELLSEPSRNQANGDHHSRPPATCKRGHYLSNSELLGKGSNGWKYDCVDCREEAHDAIVQANKKRWGALP